MKCIALFLVLSMVVLMAEPGEGFLFHGGHSHHGTNQGVNANHGCGCCAEVQQEQLDKRSVDYDPDQTPSD